MACGCGWLWMAHVDGYKASCKLWYNYHLPRTHAITLLNSVEYWFCWFSMNLDVICPVLFRVNITLFKTLVTYSQISCRLLIGPSTEIYLKSYVQCLDYPTSKKYDLCLCRSSMAQSRVSSDNQTEFDFFSADLIAVCCFFVLFVIDIT